jgi:hypothetical protein
LFYIVFYDRFSLKLFHPYSEPGWRSSIQFVTLQAHFRFLMSESARVAEMPRLASARLLKNHHRQPIPGEKIGCPKSCLRINPTDQPTEVFPAMALTATNSGAISLKQPHPFVMLLVPWKGLIFRPPFLFQVGDDVQAGRLGSLVAPKFAHLLDAGTVMAQLAVAHPEGGLACKLVQPEVNFLKRFPQRGFRFDAVFCE